MPLTQSSPDGSCFLARTRVVLLLSVVIGTAGASRSHGDEPFMLKGHTGRVMSLAFSPNGKLLASSAEDETVRVWDLSSGKEILKHQFFCIVLDLSFSPDGQFLACGSSQPSYLVRRQPEGMNAVVNVLSALGYQRLASYLCQPEGMIAVINLQSGRTEKTFTGHNIVSALAFSPDGKRIASGEYDKIGKVWDFQSGKVIRTLNGHQGLILSLDFSPDGKLLATGGGRGKAGEVFLWDPDVAQPKRIVPRKSPQVNDVAFLPDGQTLATLTYDDVKLWDVKTGKLKKTLKDGFLQAMAVSPNGKTLVAVGYDITFWNVQTGKESVRLKTLYYSSWSVCFSPDGKILATGSDDSSIRLWNANTRQPLSRGSTPSKDKSNREAQKRATCKGAVLIQDN